MNERLNPVTNDNPPRRSKRRVFTIRAMLVGVAILCIVFALIAWAKTPRSIVKRIESFGGQADPMGLAGSGDSLLYNPEMVFGPLRRFQEIRYVEMQSNEFNDKDLEAVCSLQTVSSLTITSESITDEGLKSVANCPNLQSLFLIAPVTDDGLGVVRELGSLRTLNVHSDQVTGDFLGALDQRRGCVLQALSLSGTNMDDRAVDHLIKCPWLENVSLRDTGITDEGLAKLAAVEHLRTLDVRETKVTREGIEQFQQLAPGVDVKW